MENTSLIAALTLVSCSCSLALFANWYSNRLIPGLLQISLGYACMTLGFLLFSLHLSLDASYILMLISTLLMGGRTIMLFGFAAFWHQEGSRLRYTSVILLIVSAVTFYYFTIVDDALLWRSRVYSLYMVFIASAHVYLLVNGLRIERKLRPVMAITTSFGAYGLIALLSFNVVSLLIASILRPEIALADPDNITAGLLLVTIFTMMFSAIAIIIMTTEELSVEHNENVIFDPITTILNHRTFLEVSKRVLGVALRYTKPVSMLALEVTNLDEITKLYGMRLANEMLLHFSLMATDRRRNEDVLARSGFNQFHMLLPGVDEAGAAVVIDKVRQAVESEDFVYKGRKLEIHLVIASITRREEDLHLQQMLQECELALFKAKHEAFTTR